MRSLCRALWELKKNTRVKCQAHGGGWHLVAVHPWAWNTNEQTPVRSRQDDPRLASQLACLVSGEKALKERHVLARVEVVPASSGRLAWNSLEEARDPRNAHFSRGGFM
jgi:hypothetical protein